MNATSQHDSLKSFSRLRIGREGGLNRNLSPLLLDILDEGPALASLAGDVLVDAKDTAPREAGTPPPPSTREGLPKLVPAHWKTACLAGSLAGAALLGALGWFCWSLLQRLAVLEAVLQARL